VQELDLRQDEVEEYEGRIVRVRGTTYQIGPWLGEGAERVVHRLRNVRSGLTLHLFKVLREGDRAVETAEKAAGITRAAHDAGLLVPEDSLVVAGHGGVFEMEEQPSPESDELADLEATAEGTPRASWFTEADERCREVLAVNPDHTQALHLLAHVAYQKDDRDTAMGLRRRALEVESNVRPYWFGLLTQLAADGMLQSFLKVFSDLTERWPREGRMNVLAARVLLALGRPEEAGELNLRPIRSRNQSDDSARREDEERTGLACQIEREQKAHSRAVSELILAKKETLSKRDEQALEALRRAYQHYPNDARVALNLAFANLRQEAWSDAYDLLRSVPAVLVSEIYVQHLGSMAFASAGIGDLQRATSLLEEVASNLDAVAAGDAIGYWDLPGWVRWWEDGIVTLEKSDRPAQLVESVVENIESPSVRLQSLAELYARGPDGP
jgi:tetratricopeptide (TPR) repeat protein